ncbi:RNA polymerase factor sigma-54 [Silanimonas sp.]|jgi:RNA polymerase sigma-54 factor|uniref:RNA polymerase factor sigma-54 n=1 Tax=Silanimonas sp. TaxID=1929290 RepID=UPI0022C700D3|nr:RNA polymerase factor sigma-54 [Silanimonas sp.]MCZ8114094.1 RNA polymerase factor sigma-54 [Silanimonas sp.]
MKPALQAKLGTALALTPQLRQAIRLLQLSQLELEAELQAAVETNPLLELAEPGDDDGAAATLDDGADNGATENADGTGTGAGDDVAAIDDELDGEDWTLGDDDAGPRQREGDEDGEREEAGAAPGLHEHLRWQLRMSVHSARDEAIGEAVIDALDDDGYLREPLEALPAALPAALEVTLDDVRALLRLVQQFDPIGCGARDLAECLGLQLAALSTDTPGLALAQRLVAGHLDAIARQRPDRLAAELGVDPADVLEAIALVKSLDPKPGARFDGAPAEYVQPDAIALKQRGVWRVRMARGGGGLRLNAHYQGLIGRCSRDDDAYLRGQLQEARWLIKALENRGETLQRVAEAIVRTQSAFLDHGLEAMRPLTLRDVAEQLDLHESTISRATTRKYLRTPRGTFEFKFFFSTGLATEHGGAASSTAVQAMIRKMIEAEPSGKPLSDQSLADALKAEGIAVARRTVAKYREGLGIPPSSERGQR